jgi:hypothetical protein
MQASIELFICFFMFFWKQGNGYGRVVHLRSRSDFLGALAYPPNSSSWSPKRHRIGSASNFFPSLETEMDPWSLLEAPTCWLWLALLHSIEATHSVLLVSRHSHKQEQLQLRSHGD